MVIAPGFANTCLYIKNFIIKKKTKQEKTPIFDGLMGHKNHCVILQISLQQGTSIFCLPVVTGGIATLDAMRGAISSPVQRMCARQAHIEESWMRCLKTDTEI